MIAKKNRDQLLSNGFCKIPRMLTIDMLNKLRKATDLLLDLQTTEEKATHRSQGSSIEFNNTSDTLFADLITLPSSLQALSNLGFKDITFTAGFIISKPALSPQLYWHYDWFSWQDPSMYEPVPPQVFFMYYLTDTRRQNGCLRVIAGSHSKYNTLHALIGRTHRKELNKATDLNQEDFKTRPDEIDVPVNAGDLLIGDARLLHASHPNHTNKRRTVLTLWYQPDFSSLPERVRAQLVDSHLRPVSKDWLKEGQAKVAALNPNYTGTAEPYKREFRSRKKE